MPANTPAPMAEATQAAPPPTTEQRLDAIELFLQHLVLVAECEPRFTADALTRWLDIARQRMQATGSVATGTQAALARLQRKVLA